MNIYEKLQGIRCVLQDSNLKKTGKNPFAKYEYFELQDIVPTINNLMLKNKVVSELSYNKEIACLRLINSEKPDEVMSFTCPVEMAELKGCHPTQNLGATITYIRRYLYINAFEIVEHDALDRMPMDNTAQNTQKQASQPVQAPIKAKPMPSTLLPEDQALMAEIADAFAQADTQIALEFKVKDYKLKLLALPKDCKEYLRNECKLAQARINDEIATKQERVRI